MKIIAGLEKSISLVETKVILFIPTQLDKRQMLVGDFDSKSGTLVTLPGICLASNKVFSNFQQIVGPNSIVQWQQHETEFGIKTSTDSL